jgi:anti-sigma factor RsiW
VANITAEVEARTIGAKLKWPALAPGLHWAVDPAFGFRTVSGDEAHVGSVLVYWYGAALHDATPPDANLPDRAGTDPHEYPRRDPAAADQVSRFLLTGDLIDVCGGGPCTIPAPT